MHFLYQRFLQRAPRLLIDVHAFIHRLSGRGPFSCFLLIWGEYAIGKVVIFFFTSQSTLKETLSNAHWWYSWKRIIIFSIITQMLG